MSPMRRSRTAPSSPTSLNPAEITTRCLVPSSAACRTTPFDVRGRNDHDHQVRDLVDGLQVLEARDAQDPLGLRVHRVDDPRVVAVDQIADHRMAHRADFAGRADDGNRPGEKQRPQITSWGQRQGATCGAAVMVLLAAQKSCYRLETALRTRDAARCTVHCSKSSRVRRGGGRTSGRADAMASAGSPADGPLRRSRRKKSHAEAQRPQSRLMRLPHHLRVSAAL